MIIEFPEPRFRIRKEEGKSFIFDEIRKTWLVLTEEEWVRQNFVQYLTRVMHYPTALMALEKEIMLNGLKKRFDVLVYNREHQPWMMIECKSPEIQLNETALLQALRYHMSIPVDFIILTNGKTTAGWKKQEGTMQWLEKLPSWE
ncbi:MAG: type I restriction enzyme HsdR N-terminal domain-containing protein [Flavisolibacter sp.]